MDANGPEAGGSRHRLPHLLRDPRDAADEGGLACEAVGEYRQIDGLEGAKSCTVEAMAWRYEQARSELVMAEDMETGTQPVDLLGFIDTGELRCGMERNEASTSSVAQMTVPMQCNSCAFTLKVADAHPEVFERVDDDEFGVVVVRHDGEDGANCEAAQ